MYPVRRLAFARLPVAHERRLSRCARPVKPLQLSSTSDELKCGGCVSCPPSCIQTKPDLHVFCDDFTPVPAEPAEPADDGDDSAPKGKHAEFSGYVRALALVPSVLPDYLAPCVVPNTVPCLPPDSL